MPPVIFEEFAADYPWEATGVLALDQWIYNSDRNSGNLASHPKCGVAVFDHDLSLIAAMRTGIAAKLAEWRDTELRGHPLAPCLRAATYFEAWCDRIKGVTTEEVRRIVGTCEKAGILEPDIAEELTRFIEHRKLRVAEYFTRVQDNFSSVTSWPIASSEADDGV